MDIKEWLNNFGRSKYHQMFGGVCAGLGLATGISISLWRVLVVISMFFGIGLILYPLLWILLPYHQYSDEQLHALNEENSLFYRLEKGKVLGGICTAMEDSTGYPVWLFRLGWVVLALVSGVGVLIYLILWGVLPLRDAR